MKCIVIIALSCAVALNAHPFGIGLGLGRRLGLRNGLCLGRIGGIRMGVGGLGTGAIGRGALVVGRMGGYANGGGYGSTGYSSGASGVGSQGYQNAGTLGLHNIGTHHNKVTSINKVDNSDFHNIGGGSAMFNGGYAGKGNSRFDNGASQFGNAFGAGQQGII